MSIADTKSHLIKLLDDTENKVIALSGKWGTGKSHLWQNVREESSNEETKKSLYVSLFGLSDLAQVKFKIIQSALPDSKNRSAAWKSVADTLTAGKQMLSGINRGFSALDELALLAVPTILKKKMIVLDDIERKHEKLSIDEILGFIDEFTQQYHSRFVLVLNSDKLANRLIWDTLREKVIDQEVKLETSSIEACNIALEKTPSNYAAQISKAVEICKISNIRIIRKIIKAANLILGNRSNVPNDVVSRVVPSIVLLSAINYKGIENGPDFQFVLSFRSLISMSRLIQSQSDENDEGNSLDEEWTNLLDDLGISGCDEFELLVVEFLESGLLEDQKISSIIDRYITERDEFAARARVNMFIERLRWDHKVSEGELLDEAKTLISTVHLLNAYQVTDLNNVVTVLDGGKDIGDEFIRVWLENFKSKSYEDFDFENYFDRDIHDDILTAFEGVEAQAQSKMTVFDACLHIASHNGWNTIQQTILRQATPNDFETIIRTLEPHAFKDFMRQMTKMCSNRKIYIEHFGSAIDNFLTACISIINDSDSKRLGQLVSRVTYQVMNERHSKSV